MQGKEGVWQRRPRHCLWVTRCNPASPSVLQYGVHVCGSTHPDMHIHVQLPGDVKLNYFDKENNMQEISVDDLTKGKKARSFSGRRAVYRLLSWSCCVTVALFAGRAANEDVC